MKTKSKNKPARPALAPAADRGRGLTSEEAAARLGVSVRTLQFWRYRRQPGLPFVRISSRAVRYFEKDVDDFMATRRVVETATPTAAVG